MHRRALVVLLTALALGAAPAPAQTAPAPAQTAPAATQTAPTSAPPAVGSVVGATVSVPPSAGTAGAPRRAPEHAAGRLAHAAGADPAVTIKDFSFGPSAVTIHVGETITWTNNGPTAHTATGSGFDTGILRVGQSSSHTFTSAGTFSYHCTLHPFMKGTITVVGAAGTPPAAAPAPSAPPPAAAAPSGSATAAAPATATATAPAPGLPNTGLDAWQVAALGALSLLCGLALRRATRPRIARTSRAPRGF